MDRLLALPQNCFQLFASPVIFNRLQMIAVKNPLAFHTSVKISKDEVFKILLLFVNCFPKFQSAFVKVGSAQTPGYRFKKLFMTVIYDSE